MKAYKVISAIIALIILLSSCGTPVPPTESPLPLLQPPVSIQPENPPLAHPEDQVESETPPIETPDETTFALTISPSASPTSSPSASASLSSNLAVHFIDVGIGDCILVELPNDQIMLIDGGSRASSHTVLAYIDSLNISLIDYLIITHPHEDHIGGLPEVIDSYDISEIYMPRVSDNTPIFERLLTTIQDNNYTIHIAKAGVTILSMPNLQIDIVAPVSESYSNLNDYSAVVRLMYGDVAFLFTGDAEAASEGEITADIQSDVLKVGHHGSNTSTTESFLRRVNPSYAVISVGAGYSYYGYPHDEVLARLFDAEVNVYRTDEAGTIIITTDGMAIDVNASPSSPVTPPPTPAPTPTPTPN